MSNPWSFLTCHEDCVSIQSSISIGEVHASENARICRIVHFLPVSQTFPKHLRSNSTELNDYTRWRDNVNGQNECWSYKVFMWQTPMPAAQWWMSGLCLKTWASQERYLFGWYCIPTIHASAISVFILTPQLQHGHSSFMTDCCFPAVMLRSVAHWNRYQGIGLTRSMELGMMG